MLLKQSFKNKNILILGFGTSGQSAANLLSPIAKNVFVYDKAFTVSIQRTNLPHNSPQISFIPKNSHIFSHTTNSQSNIEFLSEIDTLLHSPNKPAFCIISPGISKNSLLAQKVKSMGVRLMSELELGTIFCQGRIFAITGTNGKTTACHKLFHIFKAQKKQCFLCGNVGTPITQIAPFTTPKSLIVLEVSSFQLETFHHFHPHAAAILNITPDHLDRHKTFKCYSQEKLKIFSCPTTKKYANLSDPVLTKLTKSFHNITHLSDGISPLARFAGISQKSISIALKTFNPLPHRIEVIGSKNNITFINDSKATNPQSTIFALSKTGPNTILILGGQDAKFDFTPLLSPKFLHVFGFGEVGATLEKLFPSQNFTLCKTLDEALEKAVLWAKNFHVTSPQTPLNILLSPATKSFDQFTSYSHRGNHFKSLVQKYLK